MFTGFNELIGLNFALQKPSPSTGAIWYAAGPVVVLMFASLVYSISSKNRKELNIGKLKYDDVSAEIADAARGSFQRSDDDEVSWKSASDGKGLLRHWFHYERMLSVNYSSIFQL